MAVTFTVAAGIALLLLVASFPLGLNGDVQYVLGALRAYEADQLLGFVETFTHRPIAYRFVVTLFTEATGLLGIHEDALHVFEGTMRVLGVLASAGAGIAIWRGLGPRLGFNDSAALGFAAALTLGLAPNWDFLQAEWFASLFVTLGVAAALGPRDGRHAGVLSGLMIVMAVAVKLATLPLGALAVVLIALVDRRRAISAVAGALFWGALWLFLVQLAGVELIWMRDMIALNPNSPVRVGLGTDQLGLIFSALGAKLALSPFIIGGLGAMVVLLRTISGVPARLWIGIGLMVAVLLSVAPLIAQGQWFLYHLATLPVLSAAVVALATLRWWRATGRLPLALLIPLPLLALASTVALTTPPEWRTENGDTVMWALGVSSLVMAIAAMLEPQTAHANTWARRHLRGPAAACAMALCFGPSVTPDAAWSLKPDHTPYTNAGWATLSSVSRADLSAESGTIGRATTVLYLAYGDVAYHMGNPTDCRYPSPLFVQRVVYFPWVRSIPSYRDTVICIAESAAPYAVVQPGWFQLTRLPSDVQEMITNKFDCGAAQHRNSVVVCPARSE